METYRWYGVLFACISLPWMLIMHSVAKAEYSRSKAIWLHARLVWTACALAAWALGVAGLCLGAAVALGLSGPASEVFEWGAGLMGIVGLLALPGFIVLLIVERTRYGKS